MLYATGLLIFGQICQKNIGFKFFFYQKLEMWDMYLTIMSYLWKHLGFTEIFTFFIFCFLLHFLFFVQMISIKIKQMVSITKKKQKNKTKQNKTNMQNLFLLFIAYGKNISNQTEKKITMLAVGINYYLLIKNHLYI